MPFALNSAAVLWRRLEVPGYDACRLEPTEDGWRLSGTAVFCQEGVPARLDYWVRCDRTWRTCEGRITGWFGESEVSLVVTLTDEDGWLLNGSPVPGLDGCVDVDFGFTPATNLLQLRRIDLAVGRAADVPVAWLDVPANTLLCLEQRYHRQTNNSYGYQSPQFDYQAVLEVDDTGFVRNYPDLWVAEC